MRFSALCSVLFLAALPSAVQAGAWTQEEGAGQAILTLAYSRADEAYGESGDAEPIRPFQKAETRLYLEYGWTDWATLLAQPELRWKEQGGETSIGLGRVDLGLRTRLWRDDFAVVSVQGSLRIPGQTDELEPLNGGDTGFEADLRGLYGRGFEFRGRHGYVDLQAGYRHRVDEPPGELRLDLTLGWDLAEPWSLYAQSFNAVAVGGAGGRFERTRSHEIALGTLYSWNEEWALQVGAFTVVAGENALREHGLTLGIWRSF